MCIDLRPSEIEEAVHHSPLCHRFLMSQDAHRFLEFNLLLDCGWMIILQNTLRIWGECYPMKLFLRGNHKARLVLAAGKLSAAHGADLCFGDGYFAGERFLPRWTATGLLLRLDLAPTLLCLKQACNSCGCYGLSGWPRDICR